MIDAVEYNQTHGIYQKMAGAFLRSFLGRGLNVCGNIIKFLFVGSRTLLRASFIHTITDTNLRSATLCGKYP